MRSTNDKMFRLLLPVAVGAGCMFALLSAMSTVTEGQNLSPHIGDIVSFVASTDAPLAGGTLITGARPNQPFCDLDLNTLRHFGGSLVVESEVADNARRFVVHWAGARTAGDRADCGRGTDLVLDSAELDQLAISAGGYGTVEKRLPIALTDLMR